MLLLMIMDTLKQQLLASWLLRVLQMILPLMPLLILLRYTGRVMMIVAVLRLDHIISHIQQLPLTHHLQFQI